MGRYSRKIGIGIGGLEGRREELVTSDATQTTMEISRIFSSARLRIFCLRLEDFPPLLTIELVSCR
jgi:hypothetical protein